MSLPILAPTHRTPQNRCPEGVDRDRQIEALPGPRRRAQRDRSPLYGDLGARTGLRAADIEEIGPLDDQLLGLAEELIEGPVLATVEERTGVRLIPITSARRDVETGGAELDEHVSDPGRHSDSKANAALPDKIDNDAGDTHLIGHAAPTHHKRQPPQQEARGRPAGRTPSRSASSTGARHWEKRVESFVVVHDIPVIRGHGEVEFVGRERRPMLAERAGRGDQRAPC